MNERIRGRSIRTPNPTLPTFLESDATDAVKAEVQQILDGLASQDTLDRTVLSKTEPDLLARIDTLSGAGLDLFRVLRGEKPLNSTCTRQNISASLRHKLHKQSGQLSDASYPDSHIVSLMAKVYWGSIEAWVEGRPGRACRPKGYWLKPENQYAALLDWAASHPGEPLTHATLQKAGLCALAVALDGTALASRAAELGLKRNFRRRPNGFWTRAAVMQMYAELCRTHGITLSSVALGEIGGDGYTLRDRAARLFGGFAAFQAAVALRHPEIRLPGRPTAQDGRQLDSWQEVVVYNMMCAALPTMCIDTHVQLAGTRRSCDFVLDATCFVEVLRHSRAEMETPRNADARKYAGRWSAKMALYRTMNVTPIVIEPGDIHDPERLGERMAEIAARLSTPMQPLLAPAPGRKALRPKGSWTFDALCAAVGEVADVIGRWPTHVELIAAGYGQATNLLKKAGMASRVSVRIGHPLRNQKGVWSEERVVVELAEWASKHEQYPTATQLEADGLHLLQGARHRLFGGRLRELWFLVEQRCGRALPRCCSPRWRDPQPFG